MRFFQVLGFCSLLSSAVVASERQFTVTECATIEAQREAVQAEMRSGYHASEYNRLTGRELKLFNLLARHCQKPERDDYLLEEPRSRQPSTQSSDDLPESFPMMRSDNAVFVGEQAKAWDIYYQMPDQCRLHQQTRQDFVFCAEDKKRQREAFLQNWQVTQAAKAPDTPIDQQQKAKVTAAKQAVMASVAPVSQKVVEVLSPEQQFAEVIKPARQPDLQHATALSEQRTERLSDQLSLVWIGAFLVFCWMSWLLWRR